MLSQWVCQSEKPKSDTEAKAQDKKLMFNPHPDLSPSLWVTAGTG